MPVPDPGRLLISTAIDSQPLPIAHPSYILPFLPRLASFFVIPALSHSHTHHTLLSLRLSSVRKRRAHYFPRWDRLRTTQNTPTHTPLTRLLAARPLTFAIAGSDSVRSPYQSIQRNSLVRLYNACRIVTCVGRCFCASRSSQCGT